MFCRFCGAALFDDSKYCHSCGKPLGAPSTSPSKSPAADSTQAQTGGDKGHPLLIAVSATVVLVGLASIFWLRSHRSDHKTGAEQDVAKGDLKTKVKPSFDCAKARTAVDKEICADSDLASLEVAMVAAYRLALERLPPTDQAELRLQHLRWFNNYQESCNSAARTGNGLKECISRALSGHTRDLKASTKRDVLAAGDSLPTAVGECSTTTVSKIGTRLTEGVNGPDIPGSGSLIFYADGGSQVSYDTIPAIERSQVGDKVLLCLVSIPTSCPPGDDRGRVYNAKNIRTGETWRLPDSQHSCGGA